MSYLRGNIGGTFPILQGLQIILLIFRKVMGQQCNEITRTIMIKIFDPLAGIFKKSKKTGTGKPCAVSHPNCDIQPFNCQIVSDISKDWYCKTVVGGAWKQLWVTHLYYYSNYLSTKLKKKQ